MKKAVLIMLCLCLLLTACAVKGRRGGDIYDDTYNDADSGDPKSKKEAEFIKGGGRGQRLNVYEAYKAELEKLRADGASGGYALHDIDDDGVPEMIARVGSSGGGTTVYIHYMSESGAEQIDLWPERMDIVPLGAADAILLHRGADGEESLFEVKFSDGTCEVTTLFDGYKLKDGEKPLEFDNMRLTDVGSDDGLDWLENKKDENDKILKEFMTAKPKPQSGGKAQTNWKDDYTAALSELGTEEFFGYALYDLDCDGVPEMLMQTYSDASGRSTYIVDFENEKRTVTDIYAGSGVIAGYYDESTVVFHIAENGEESVSVLNYKGGYATTIEIVSRTLKYGERYLELKPLTLYAPGDMAGLEWTKNPADHNKSVVESLG